jgi:hypothetical protein
LTAQNCVRWWREMVTATLWLSSSYQQNHKIYPIGFTASAAWGVSGKAVKESVRVCNKLYIGTVAVLTSTTFSRNLGFSEEFLTFLAQARSIGGATEKARESIISREMTPLISVTGAADWPVSASS